MFAKAYVFVAGGLSTRRIVVDPLKARTLVADAAYQRFLDTMHRRQEEELKSQQHVRPV